MKNLLLDALAGWLRLAGEKSVYVEYRFCGAASELYAGEPEILKGVDKAVREMMEACAKLPEAERWMDLELSRDGEGLTLSCAAPGDCKLPPGAWLHPGIQIVFRREEENVRLEVKARNSPKNPQTEKPGQGGTPLSLQEALQTQTTPDGRGKPKEEKA